MSKVLIQHLEALQLVFYPIANLSHKLLHVALCYVGIRNSETNSIGPQ